MIQAKTLLELLDQRSEDPSPRIHFYRGFELRSSWSYGQIQEYSIHCADALRDQGGGKKVLLSLPNSPEFIGAFFGLQRSGAVPIPVAPPEILQVAEWVEFVRSVARTAQADAIITTPEGREILRTRGEPLPIRVLPEARAESMRDPRDASVSESLHPLALLQFSSGSTSDPKGVQITHDALLTNLWQITQALGVRQDESLVSWLPFFHDMGLIGGFFGPLYQGIDAYFHDPIDFAQDPGKWIEFVAQKRGAVMLGPDFMYRLLSRPSTTVRSSANLSALRICMTGSEPVSAAACRDFQARFAAHGLRPNALLPVYGMAEAVLGITFSKVGDPVRCISHPDDPSIELVSCGKPLEGIEVEIRDENGQRLLDNQIGLIYFRSPAQTRGYENHPDATKALLSEDGFVRTGDRGLIEQGELFITGRQKDLIIIRGRKIHPIDLERRVHEALPGATRVAAVQLDSDQAAIVVEMKTFLFSTAKLRARVMSALSGRVTLQPAHVLFVPKGCLPRTTSGKLRRFKIVEGVQNGSLARMERNFLPTLVSRTLAKSRFLKFAFQKTWNQDPIRESILEVFCRTTRISRGQIDWNKPITEYGIDSLQIHELLAGLEKEVGKIPVLEFYRLKTLQDVYEFVRKREGRSGQRQ